MLINFKGLKTEDYHVPSFQLNQGEIALVYLHGGAHYYPLKYQLIDILTNASSDEQVTVHEPFTFVAPFKEPTSRRLFYPVTVEEYIHKNAGPDKTIAHKIYSKKQLTKKTYVKALNPMQHKLLSLYMTLSKTNNILFDLDGLCAESSDYIYHIVKDFVKSGVSAIYLDWSNQYKQDCNTCVELQWRFKPEHGKK